jgi:hypothetical protein
LGTVRYLGTFLTDPLDVPKPVLFIMAKQLSIELSDDITIAYKFRRATPASCDRDPRLLRLCRYH